MKNTVRRSMIVFAGVAAVATMGIANAGSAGDMRHPPRYKETILYSFQGSDGWSPSGRLAMDQTGALYGTTGSGGGTACNGGDGCGVVYKLTPSGSGYVQTVLYRFHGADGQVPGGVLLGPNGTLYGITSEGGSCSDGTPASGTVFTLTPSSSGYVERTLWNFGCRSGDGSGPEGVLIGADGALYGTTGSGGLYGQCGFFHLPCGTAFKLTPSGTSYTESIIWYFGRGRDGAEPSSGLISDVKGALYGTTVIGGARGNGTVYKLVLSGSRYTETILHEFADWRDGANPSGGVVATSTGSLFGTTQIGGANDRGTVYELTPSGSAYHVTVRSFEPKGPETPESPLFLAPDGLLYGDSVNGGGHSGKDGQGTVFTVRPTASRPGLALLHRFPGIFGSADGRSPFGGVIVDPTGAIYGTTSYGGGNGCYENGCGTVYKLTPL